MQARSQRQLVENGRLHALRDVTRFSVRGGDELIYKSIIVMAAIALPAIAIVNLYLRGTPSWPQLALAGAILAGALLCYTLTRAGKRDVAAVLLIGTIWLSVTIYAFESGYGMHSAAVFMYLPCMLYTSLFFGLAFASAELALTVSALLVMYLAEENGRLVGGSNFIADGANFNFLIGVITTIMGTLAAGVVYHRRVEQETAGALAEAEQRRLALEQVQVTQAQLKTAHAKLQALHTELAQQTKSRDVEIARTKRDLDLLHDVVSKDMASSLRELRQALAAPDDRTEARLDRELGRMEAVIGALDDLGRHSQPKLQRAPLDLAVIAEEIVRDLRAQGDLPRVRFHIDASLRADGDRKLLSALLRHLLKRAARACQSEPAPLVRLSGGSRDGEAVFFVRDNGPGMDTAKEKLFRPFEGSRADENTVDIGIVSARRIVERHGGELNIESEPGNGTTYFFSLPAA